MSIWNWSLQKCTQQRETNHPTAYFSCQLDPVKRGFPSCEKSLALAAFTYSQAFIIMMGTTHRLHALLNCLSFMITNARKTGYELILNTPELAIERSLSLCQPFINPAECMMTPSEGTSRDCVKITELFFEIATLTYPANPIQNDKIMSFVDVSVSGWQPDVHRICSGHFRQTYQWFWSSPNCTTSSTNLGTGHRNSSSCSLRKLVSSSRFHLCLQCVPHVCCLGLKQFPRQAHITSEWNPRTTIYKPSWLTNMPHIGLELILDLISRINTAADHAAKTNARYMFVPEIAARNNKTNKLSCPVNPKLNWPTAVSKSKVKVSVVTKGEAYDNGTVLWHTVRDSGTKSKVVAFPFLTVWPTLQRWNDEVYWTLVFTLFATHN